MKSAPNRPVAVWIALGILLTYIPLLVVVLILSSSKSVLDARDVGDLVVDIAEAATVILLLMIAFWALAIRRQWGRWFVLSTLTYIVGLLIWGRLFSSELLVESPEDKSDLLVGACVGLSPLLLVVLLVSFGSNVKNYFAATAEPRKEK